MYIIESVLSSLVPKIIKSKRKEQRKVDTTKLTISPKELAKMLGVNTQTAYSLTKQKGFPAIRVSERRIIIPIDALNRWLNETAEAPKSHR